MRRREFLSAAAMGAASWPTLGQEDGCPRSGNLGYECDGDEFARLPPTYSVIPVVGDGRWIWKDPPKDQTGYLEPRAFRLAVGIELTGRGNSTDITATTPVPVGCPEQTIDSARIETEGGCEAAFRDVTPLARQLAVYVPHLATGRRVSATAHFELTLRKQFFAYERGKFAEQQKLPADVRAHFLGDSPGIQTRTPQVRDVLKQLGDGAPHPWDLARRAAEWVGQNIRPQTGAYTSVTKALEDRVGDCEEMAGVFTALVRAAGIPARLVWIPNHVWSEMYLIDTAGEGHWIPVHTACYHWFGWTGVHELVLQKGDRLKVPGKSTLVRLQQDRMRWTGARPEVRYRAELTPLPPKPESSDLAAVRLDPQAAGPGARRKVETGEWRIVGTHPLDAHARR